MIIILKENADAQQFAMLEKWLTDRQMSLHVSKGSHRTILGLIGDTSALDVTLIQQMEIVEGIRRIQEPFKKANRKFHPLDTVIRVKDTVIGDGCCCIIAGPCSVETPEQILTVARSVKNSGAHILRGGAFKPRTSPYSFQGLRAAGIKMLLDAARATGLPVVTEIMDLSQLELFNDVDIIQVGARNMQNFELLHELGHTRKPILLKRGLANTYQELLMSAEHIMNAGNENIILCERGIRTFENHTRNTLDVSAVPALKSLSHLPVIIDPSHAAGIAAFVRPLSRAAVAVGADGLMIEVHNDPQHALCDGSQSLTMPDFAKVAGDIRRFASLRMELES